MTGHLLIELLHTVEFTEKSAFVYLHLSNVIIKEFDGMLKGCDDADAVG